MFKFIEDFLDGWERIDDLPTWIDKTRLKNKGIIRGRTFVYRYDNHWIKSNREWPKEAISQSCGYISDPKVKPTYHKRKLMCTKSVD